MLPVYLCLSIIYHYLHTAYIYYLLLSTRIYLSGERVELGVEAGDDREDARQLVVHEVVVVDPVVEGVQRQPVEEGALVLGLADDEGNLRKIFY